jgi:hypothetical protein
VNDNFSGFFSGLSGRTLTVRSTKGQPFLHLRLIHVAGAAVAGVILAPRMTAIATLGLLVKGYTLKLDPSDPAV